MKLVKKWNGMQPINQRNLDRGEDCEEYLLRGPEGTVQAGQSDHARQAQVCPEETTRRRKEPERRDLTLRFLCPGRVVVIQDSPGHLLEGVIRVAEAVRLLS